jgi:hypothetical protein
LPALRSVISCLGILLALWVLGCGNGDDDAELSEPKLRPDWKLQSAAFVEGQRIPERFTCEGEDISPALTWSDPPEGTNSLALLMDDPDAPGGVFTHWILYNLSPDLRGLDENLPPQLTLNAPTNAKQGRNDFDEIGYGGPCPPRGETHTYRFRLFALNAQPEFPPEVSRTGFFEAIENHAIAEARLTGMFSR